MLLFNKIKKRLKINKNIDDVLVCGSISRDDLNIKDLDILIVNNIK